MITLGAVCILLTDFELDRTVVVNLIHVASSQGSGECAISFGT